MAKKIKAYIKLKIKAGKANPSPPIGPALGQHGVNIMEFCKAFNLATSKIEIGSPVPVVISIYTDRTFTFITTSPPTSFLLLKAVGIKKGSSEPNKNKVGKITYSQLEKIAILKKKDLTSFSLEAAIRSISGTARSLGIEIERKK